MVTIPRSTKTTTRIKTTKKTLNQSEMSQDRNVPTGMSAYRNDPKMSIEEKTIANKNAKGVKKDFKEIAKTSKESMEEMIKINKEANEKIEERMDNVGTKIARAVTGEIREGMEEMSRMMGGIMEQLVKQNEKTHQEIEKMNAEKSKPDKEVNHDERLDDGPSTRNNAEEERMSQEDTQDDSLPNAQSKFRTMTQDDNNQLRLENENLRSNIEELMERMDRQEDKTRIIENKIKLIKPTPNKEEVKIDKTEIKKNQPPIKPIPAISCNMDGSEVIDSSRVEAKNYDWTQVKLPRRRWEQRPNLTDTMNTKVTEELEEHIKEKYRGEKVPKTIAQTSMTQDERLEAIKEMLAKTSLHVGVGPISMDHIMKVEKALIIKGVLKKDEHPNFRKQRTVKSLVKSWSLKHLKMSEEEFESIEIETILMADNSDILFIKCRTQDDATKFTSKAKNLPQENTDKSPRIIMYVDRRASKRHRAIMTIAKSIREYSKNTVQTSVRTGKTDFLL